MHSFALPKTNSAWSYGAELPKRESKILVKDEFSREYKFSGDVEKLLYFAETGDFSREAVTGC